MNKRIILKVNTGTSMKKLMFLFMLPFICQSGLTFAQGTLKGKVTEINSGGNLEGVNIYINEIQRGTVTNSDGEYLFQNLPSGNYHIQFSYVGYKPEIEVVEISNSVNVVDVNLSAANINMGEVLILGNTIRAKEKVPYKIETVSKSELKDNGMLSVANSLALLPGISELSNGAGISKPVIRGLTGYRVAPVINGLRVDNQQWQDEHDFGLNDVGAERIEIIEGPASLLYGSQALGGVIKIENEKNAPVNRIVGNYNLKIFSNTLGASTEIGLKGSKEKLSWQVHASGQSHADYLAGGEEKVPNTRFASIGAAGMLTYNSSWGVSSLNYNFSHQINGVVEEADLSNLRDLEEDHFEREFEGPHHIVDFHILSLRNTFLLGSSTLKINVGYQNNSREEEEGSENKEAAGRDENELGVVLNTFSIDAQWIKSFSPNTELTIGAQSNFQGNENEGGRILIPNAETNEISLFSYLKHDFGIIDVDAGLRFDSKNIESDRMGTPNTEYYFEKLSSSYQTINAAAGVSIAANKNLTFKLNAATGYRAPNLSELTSNGVHEGTTRYEIGDAELKSESSLQTDFGINFQNRNLNLNLSVFYNLVDNFIYLQPTNTYIGTNRIYQFKQSNANLSGGELSADINLTEWLSLGASYSKVIGKKDDGTYLPLMPADKIIGKMEFHRDELFSLREYYFALMIRSYMKQDNIADEETATPAYSLIDISLGSTVKLLNLDVDLAVNVTNLLDKKYYSHLSLLKSLGILNMGRNISLALNIPFNIE